MTTSPAGWAGLYRARAFCAFGLALSAGAGIALVAAVPPPAAGTDGVETLRYIADHRLGYLVEQVVWYLPCLFGAVVFLALGVALSSVERSSALLASFLGVVGWAGALVWPATGGGAPALILLSDHYASATDPARRAALAAAAESFTAMNEVPVAAGILEAAAILAVSLLGLRGVLPRRTAWVGVATGAVGVFAESLRPVIGAGYGLYGVLLLVWAVVIGLALRSLARGADHR